ncbi:MAG: hypothetical protein K6E87_06415 [bacterium]|nr:hypothetical protein [bacterium]
MTKRKNRIILISISAIAFIFLIAILCICFIKKNKSYKYNGEIYEDSYDYKDDYGYLYLKETNPTLTKLYEDLYLEMVDFSHKDIDVRENDCYYIFYKEDINNKTLTHDDLWQVYAYINIENPQFYWVDEVLDEDGLYCIGINSSYIKSKDRKKYNKKIEEGLKTVDNLVKDTSDEFDKIKTIYDFIVDNMSYANKDMDKVWAHNIIGFFDRNEGVCETYAKMFKLLCDRYNIGNIPVVSDNHIWNLALYENQWYVFDLTWDEGSYFYFGKTEKIYELDSSDRDSHEYAAYLYSLPENMATTSLSFGLIELKDSGNTIASSHSMDHIFSKFNNGKYEIVLNNIKDGGLTNFYISSIDSKYDTLTISYTQNKKEKGIVNIEDDIHVAKDLTTKNIYFTSIKSKKVLLNDSTLYIKNVSSSGLVTFEGGNVVPIE